MNISRLIVAWLVAATPLLRAETKDLGKGFFDHGVAAPLSLDAGAVATVDGQGRDVILAPLNDHRGCYALLMIDADTGKSEQIPMPFEPNHDGPSEALTLLSTSNKFYLHFNSHFCEFDPAKRAFSFCHETAPKTGMGMTEDDQGVIWSVSHPQCGLIAFNPRTRAFTDYGHVYQQNWTQEARHIAADDAGWIYFGIGNTASQIIAFDPRTRQAKPMIPEAERVARTAGYVYRDMDGKVYGYNQSKQNGWIEFYKGEARKIGTHADVRPKPARSGKDPLSRQRFPDGRRPTGFDLVTRTLAVEDSRTGTTNSVPFDYTTEGAYVMGVADAPDGTICGGSAFPFRFFSYNPRTDQWIRREAYGQWNAMARQGAHFFVGAYVGGGILDWVPGREWVTTQKGNTNSNPLFLGENREVMNRPHKLLPLPDGRTVVMAGAPGGGATGGGLVFWNGESRTKEQIPHTAILPDHTTMSMVALTGETFLAGTSTRPGSGGVRKAAQAELYIMNWRTKAIVWHEPVFPGAQDYTDLCLGPDGLVYGLAGFIPWDPAVLKYGKRLFVFDPAKRKALFDMDTEPGFGPVGYQQGPRDLLVGPDGNMYVLFVNGIARFDPPARKLTLLAESPVPIVGGGAWLEGRIYFTSGSHLNSYAVPGLDGHADEGLR